MADQAKLNELLVQESENGRAEGVKLLLDAGADVHAGDDEALRWASEMGRTETVKLLEAAAIASAAATETQKIFKEMGIELTQPQAVKVSAFLAARPAAVAKPQAPAP
jgi:ankyrin repeat protein